MDKDLFALACFEGGLINNPDICIKDWGTTFVCVCDKCRKEMADSLRKTDFAFPITVSY